MAKTYDIRPQRVKQLQNYLGRSERRDDNVHNGQRDCSWYLRRSLGTGYHANHCSLRTRRESF
ncbi:hypothetical protein BC834DRAFT_901987 [Gloeopeniophorella convolvens]|nr:hypothetical protein BC834DRAFT_901987 [Gloeopeniophorella convolvens]